MAEDYQNFDGAVQIGKTISGHFTYAFHNNLDGLILLYEYSENNFDGLVFIINNSTSDLDGKVILHNYSENALDGKIIIYMHTEGSVANSYSIATGTYTGDGNDDRTITVGFEPTAVFVFVNSPAFPTYHPCWRTSSMGNDQCKRWATGGTHNDRIQSFVSTGFVIGSDDDVNLSGTTYIWIAFGNNGANDIVVGTYTGNGNDDRQINIGFEPELVIVQCDTSTAPVWKTSSVSSERSLGTEGAGVSTNAIQSLNSSGFVVGTSSYVNSNGLTYYYFAIENISSLIKSGSYTGNDVDGRNITGVGFNPTFAWVKNEAYNLAGVVRSLPDSGDWSYQMGDITTASNQIQNLITDGIELGSDDQVNWSVYGTYHYVVFIDGGGGIAFDPDLDGKIIIYSNSSNSLDGKVIIYKHTGDPTTSFQVKLGTYVGDGTASHAITGIGFQPKLVLVKGSGQYAMWRSTSMTSRSYVVASIGGFTNGILSLDADGFTVGNLSYVNNSGTTFYYIAIAGDDIATGSYVGNSADNRQITGLGINPDVTIVQVEATAWKETMWRISSMVGDDSSYFGHNYPDIGNAIQNLITDGFELGTDTHVNFNGETYHYIAFTNIGGLVKEGLYVGDGNDNRNITGVGFQPDFVFVKIDTTFYAQIWHSFLGGDNALPVNNGAAASNVIQGVSADGFQVGSNNASNALGADVRYISFQEGASTFNPDLDGKILIFDSSINDFDGKVLIHNNSSSDFDGKVVIFLGYPSQSDFDGKIILYSNTSSDFDGKIILYSNTSIDFDGKIEICNSSQHNCDGKVFLYSSSTNALDGKINFISGSVANFFDGKIFIWSYSTVAFNGRIRIWKESQSDISVYASDVAVTIRKPQSSRPTKDSTPRVWYDVVGVGVVQECYIYVDDRLVYSSTTGAYGQLYFSDIEHLDGKVVITSG